MQRAGKYNKHVQIWRSTSHTTNTDGQRVPVETEYTKRWMGFRPTKGEQKVIGQQIRSDVTHVFRMRSDRYTREIRPEYWLTFEGRRFDIKWIFDPDEREMELQAECIEVISELD